MKPFGATSRTFFSENCHLSILIAGLAWSPLTSRGYYQILKKSLASHGEDFAYRSEDGEPLFCWQQQSPEEEATVIANAMKKIQHVIEVFEEACKVDLEMALGAAHHIYRNAP